MICLLYVKKNFLVFFSSDSRKIKKESKPHSEEIISNTSAFLAKLYFMYKKYKYGNAIKMELTEGNKRPLERHKKEP
jgi:hypothetical protein